MNIRKQRPQSVPFDGYKRLVFAVFQNKDYGLKWRNIIGIFESICHPFVSLELLHFASSHYKDWKFCLTVYQSDCYTADKCSAYGRGAVSTPGEAGMGEEIECREAAIGPESQVPVDLLPSDLVYCPRSLVYSSEAPAPSLCV
jgi:hypothetical protein